MHEHSSNDGGGQTPNLVQQIEKLLDLRLEKLREKISGDLKHELKIHAVKTPPARYSRPMGYYTEYQSVGGAQVKRYDNII